MATALKTPHVHSFSDKSPLAVMRVMTIPSKYKGNKVSLGFFFPLYLKQLTLEIDGKHEGRRRWMTERDNRPVALVSYLTNRYEGSINRLIQLSATKQINAFPKKCLTVPLIVTAVVL